MNAEPDLAALPPGTPESIRRLLRRCLQKDPNLRLRDIGDARIEIEEALSPPPQTAARQTRRFSWRAASVIAAATMAGAVWMWQSDRTPPTAVVSFRAAFPAGDIPFFGISVSPSGRQIVLCAFNRNNRLRILSIGSPDMRPVPGVESGYMPFWSPDERDVGYFNGDALMRVNLATGRTTRICGSSAPHGATWSRDGFIVFSDRGQLLRVPDTGGAPARIEMDASATEPVSRWSPQMLPDGRHVIFLERTPHGGRVRVGSLDDGKTRTLMHSDTAAVYAAGHLLFLQGTALVAERFDLNTLTVDGRLARVAEKVAPAYLSAEPLFSAGGDGVLAYVDSNAGSAGQLTWFESDGRPAGSIDQTDGGELLNPQFSPDGLRLAVNRMDPVTGNWDVWIINLLKGIKTRLTTNAAQDSDPVWSPDGRFVAFASMRDGHPAIYKKAVDGPDAEEKLYEGTDPDSYLVPYQWSSDNQWLLFDSTQRPLRWTVLALPLNGPHVPVRVFPDDGIPRYSPRISPDGKWMAYASGESGVRFDLYVQRFMAPGQKTLVSTESGIHPRWRNDGRELFYWAPPNGIFSVAMTFSGNGFEAGPPEAVIPTAPLTLIDSRAHYDVTPDGRHFLLRQPLQGAASPAATIVVNWTQLLRE